MKYHKKNKFKTVPKASENKTEDLPIEDNYQELPKWYEQEIASGHNTGEPVTEQTLIELKEEAKQCHDSEVANYNIKNSKANSNFQWMKTVMNKGTVSDKIAAHTVAIQDNPICNLETLTTLVNMVKVGKKKECFTVMETLTELFLSDLLKPDQKLTPFHSKPLSTINEMSSGNAITRRKILSRWYFEDQLKEVFTSFVLALNRAAQDTVENNKEKAITAMFKLLCGNPEQEKNLLTNIINKLGDPSQKVASKAIYCLTQLLFKHPNMQPVVLKEVEKLLFRSNINMRTQYYCLCFLSQFYLSHEESDVAKQLIQLYLAFFKACVKKGEVDSRMMSALLMGINRSYPYSKMQFEDLSAHVETFYRLVHLASFNVALQVLMLLNQISVEKMADRYYAALYKKLVDPKLLTTTHQAMLLSLLYKAMNKDTQIGRVKMFIKRLFQISLFVQPAFCTGILYLISQLLSARPELQALTLEPTKIPNVLLDDDDEEEKYYDIKIEESNDDINTDDKSGADNLNVEFKGSSWRHNKQSTRKSVVKYNPLARNPLYGGGEFLAYTELVCLKHYFHPTVALWAKEVFAGKKLTYAGDPLKDFTLIRFLDRFVYKNPKVSNEKPCGAHPTFGKRKFYKPKGLKTLAVNSRSYLNEEKQNIPVDELFLYSYLQKKYNKDSEEDDEKDNSDLESVQSEEFEEMLDKMTGFKKDDDNNEKLDFMGEIGESLKKKKNQKKRKHDEEEEKEESDEEGEVENESFDEETDDMDLEATEEDLELIGDVSDDDDLEFLSEDSDVDHLPSKKKLKKDDVSSVFASAEEFAALLDDEGGSKKKPGGSSAMANKDQASQKQLTWEENRNRWIKGFNKAVTGKDKKKGSNKILNRKKSKKPKKK
ncbi:hypothetical protein ABEB36_001152 [Hypothenemus hampei]|uniref:CCAAT/enhancer-binding protein zeta n=1 Tax=Hypothenemus hampei TaxID=57062 RepID=A0ABD1FH72_HYPHA